MAGEWKKFVADNAAADKRIAEKEKLRTLVKFGVENSSTPVSKAPQGSKQHKVDVLTYVNKVVADNEPKIADQPIFKNNINRKPTYPTRVSPEVFGKAAERIERARQMTGEKQELSTWDLLKKAANTPEEKKEIRNIIQEDYRKHGPRDMDQDDLKWIGKAKSQTEMLYPKIEIPSVNVNKIERIPPEPEISLNERIKVMADQRLRNEQRAWDNTNGRGGLAEMLRPK